MNYEWMWWTWGNKPKTTDRNESEQRCHQLSMTLENFNAQRTSTNRTYQPLILHVTFPRHRQHNARTDRRLANVYESKEIRRIPMCTKYDVTCDRVKLSDTRSASVKRKEKEKTTKQKQAIGKRPPAMHPIHSHTTSSSATFFIYCHFTQFYLLIFFLILFISHAIVAVVRSCQFTCIQNSNTKSSEGETPNERREKIFWLQYSCDKSYMFADCRRGRVSWHWTSSSSSAIYFDFEFTQKAFRNINIWWTIFHSSFGMRRHGAQNTERCSIFDSKTRVK